MMPVEATGRVDNLMRELYRRSRGTLHQTLIADYSIADAYRSLIDPACQTADRPVVRAARLFARALMAIAGARIALRTGGVVWAALGIPELVASCLRLHGDAYLRQGSAGARIVLLRTGVANEPLIAAWIARQAGDAVQMLELNEGARARSACLRHLPRLLGIHAGLCLGMLRDAVVVVDEVALDRRGQEVLLGAWFVLLARKAMRISWSHCWARLHLAGTEPMALYFTMNCANENAFRLALPGVPAAYVEHGFPRRHIPPLECRQYVYSRGYADYLRSFDASLEIAEIGLDYFPKGSIEPERTIVVASLQNWPQYRIDRVAGVFNAALGEARRNGWRLVFRTRSYDTDAFAKALEGPWDEISKAGEEDFSRCLARTRPAMVWTTWSTAVLDSRAQQLVPVAFVTPDIEDHFITDIDEFALRVSEDADLPALVGSLRLPDVRHAMAELGARIGAPHGARPAGVPGA